LDHAHELFPEDEDVLGYLRLGDGRQLGLHNLKRGRGFEISGNVVLGAARLDPLEQGHSRVDRDAYLGMRAAQIAELLQQSGDGLDPGIDPADVLGEALSMDQVGRRLEQRFGVAQSTSRLAEDLQEATILGSQRRVLGIGGGG